MKIKMQTFSFSFFAAKFNFMKARTRSRKGAPGIIEVADLAGVSPATVSRFYNSPDIVKAPTRKRIEQAALDLGYIRDRMAGTLHNRFSGTFGLIVPTIDNAIFAEMIEAFSARLQKRDRTMLIAAHGYDLILETAIVRSLLERRIDGVAMVGFDHEAVPLNMLARRDVPVVSIWNYRADSTIPCVGADNFEAGKLVTQHLVDLGHRDIAFIFPETNSNDRARDRLSGALQVTSDASIPISPDQILSCNYDIGAAKNLALSALSSRTQTAFVCGNDIIAHGVLLACQSLGIVVPDEISIVGIGDFGGSEFLEPGLTTVRLPAKRIGRQAADTLLSMSETGLAPAENAQAIQLSFIERGSTKSLSGSPSRVQTPAS